MQGPTPAAMPRLRVLIVGDDNAQLGVVRRIFGERGHELLGAAAGCIGGAMVPALFSEHRPDVAVIDLQCESSGGYQAVEALRLMEDPRWIPIWCLGRAGAPATEEALALERGADVFLARPLNLRLLEARVAQLTRYMSRQRQFVRRRQYLEDYFELTEDEIKSARAIMDRLLRTQAYHSGRIRSWIAPAFKFSGDATVAERSPDGSLKVLLADGVGHGLSAALNVLPVCRAFQSMAQKGFSLPAMVVELNHTIRRDLPSHRFVAATLVNLDAAAGVVEVWNGGNPAAFMIGAAGEVTEAWTSSHLPLGVVDSDELDPQPDARVLHAGGELVLFSDGAIEAQDEQGLAFGEAALLQALAKAPPGVRLEALKFAIVEHLAGRAAGDDVTLVLLDCGAELRQARACLAPPVGETPAGAGDMNPRPGLLPSVLPFPGATVAWTLRASACGAEAE
ncbi:MAG: hypothetical protein JWN73_2978 [Betaproteobacteria bacterium]|nr:hypothetical protein [Betaproteobacteria bacterium]